MEDTLNGNAKIRNQVEFKVYGKYALFSDPITRMGGEKCSYLVPTYQALKGITESCYWKPSIIWVVDEVRVMKKIRTESKNIRPISYNKVSNNKVSNTLSVYTYLADVEYQVRAHFIPNSFRPELAEDAANENKHYQIAKRMIERGGRRDVFLGTRECQAYVEPCVFGEGAGAYDDSGEVSFGIMAHGFDYPDETGRDMLAVRFWQAKMKDGIIRFPEPADCDPMMRRDVRPMKAKLFGKEQQNFVGLEEPSLEMLLREGGDGNELDHKAE